ncbi:DAK2 domain-containing protein [Mesorhizobium tamadayense]|uniref:DAK2 domain-containing protein n=1 Tax=Mesorhizobium tamadayense TaxID=425306 RepID=A0A3P3F510_9HYPH|nr:DAK2 domain-containing protein [Mesorhizobium tamadayense]
MRGDTDETSGKEHSGSGRAARLGERSQGHPDPGSVSAAMLVEEICKAMKAA